MSFDKNLFTKKLDSAITKYKQDLSTIQTRPSPNMLNAIKVDVYGDFKPINQVANISIVGNTSLVIQPWDSSHQASIIDAIKVSGMNLNPVTDGKNVKVAIPIITTERRKEFSLLVKKYLENAKISTRSIRSAERDRLKLEEKNKAISQDDFKRMEKDLQTIFDNKTKELDKISEDKIKEISND
jgi:ribosome recycling factor